MPAAGGYVDRVEWLRKVKEGRPLDTFGQPIDPFSSQGLLWCAVEDLAGGRETVEGTERQVVTATVRVRNYPAVVAGDRLTDVGRGEVWTVNHVVRGADEVLCDVSRPRVTAGGGTAA